MFCAWLCGWCGADWLRYVLDAEVSGAAVANMFRQNCLLDLEARQTRRQVREQTSVGHTGVQGGGIPLQELALACVEIDDVGRFSNRIFVVETTDPWDVDLEWFTDNPNVRTDEELSKEADAMFAGGKLSVFCVAEGLEAFLHLDLRFVIAQIGG